MNPFHVKSPEGLNAEDACSLFVNSSSDYPMLLEPAHVFLIGPRGTGKSMMFRYMMPDCQRYVKDNVDIDFFAVYVPLKKQNFNLAELTRLESAHASYLINEHILTTYVAARFFEELIEWISLANININTERQVIIDCLELIDINYSENDDELELLKLLSKSWSILYKEAREYLKLIAFSGPQPYESKLVSYLDELIPTLKNLNSSKLLAKGSIFLLMDDAHNLSHVQTQVLNGWVSTRTAGDVSIKISTQPNYKTYYTSTGDRIETPHDYSETRTAEIYTTKSKGRYYNRIRDIIERRLKKENLNIEVDSLFPCDEEQESEIRKIGDEYRQKHKDGEGRGAKPSDDAVRYARPDYIKSLGGTSKSSSTYSYAGFEQLVHVSSGITRHFLECASTMFDQVEQEVVEVIPPSIQDKVIREEANDLKFRSFSRETGDEDPRSLSSKEAEEIGNLIDALGGIFRLILLSNRSERRVYSVAFSDTPTEEFQKVLTKAVNMGYLHESSIGKKDSKVGGRTKLYVLTRRLAPQWTLDPTGFAGYLFLSSSYLQPALDDPQAFLRKFSSDKKLEQDDTIEQLELF